MSPRQKRGPGELNGAAAPFGGSQSWLWAGFQPQCHMFFPFPGNCTKSGADALVRSRPPGRLLGSRSRLNRHTPAGPGRPARTRGSAPPIDSESRRWKKYGALGFQPARLPERPPAGKIACHTSSATRPEAAHDISVIASCRGADSGRDARLGRPSASRSCAARDSRP